MTMVEDQRISLDHFDEFSAANPRKGSNAREPRAVWEQRRDLIHATFPSTAETDAHHPDSWVMRADAGLIMAIFEDIHGVGQSDAKGGRRPAADPARSAEDQRQMMGESYSELPFHEAFKVLIKSRRHSVTAATRFIKHRDPRGVGLSRSRVYRLMIDDGNPTKDEMSLIATAYGKPLEYFNEYRIAMILDALSKQLHESPETSMHIYRKLSA